MLMDIKKFIYWETACPNKTRNQMRRNILFAICENQC